MALIDDGDIVRGLGFVSMYAAWLEEDVDDLLRMLHPIAPYEAAHQRWPISRKLRWAKRLIKRLNSCELQGLPGALDHAIRMFERRNEYVHGRIYTGFNRQDYVQGGRPGAPTIAISSSDLYALANEIWDHRRNFIGPQIFRLPRAIQAKMNQYGEI